MGGVLTHPVGSVAHNARSCPLVAVGSGSVILLAVAAVILDVGNQFGYVLSAREVYELRESRARINSAFMTSMFISGAASSAVAGVLLDTAGWRAVCAFAGGETLLAIVIWLVSSGDRR